MYVQAANSSAVGLSTNRVMIVRTGPRMIRGIRTNSRGPTGIPSKTVMSACVNLRCAISRSNRCIHHMGDEPLTERGGS